MKGIFADTAYWVAISIKKDGLHSKAIAARKKLGNIRLITTYEVLIEYLNFLCSKGPTIRQLAVKTVRAILNDPNTKVFPQTRESFMAGFQLYSERCDKTYSLTDCISMAIMRKESITQVLTHDCHFKQEGFEILF